VKPTGPVFLREGRRTTTDNTDNTDKKKKKSKMAVAKSPRLTNLQQLMVGEDAMGPAGKRSWPGSGRMSCP
jgi:hypothetical protein